MKKSILILIILIFVASCDTGPKEGLIRIRIIDAPPPQDLENIYLKINEVRVLNSEGDWIVLNDYLPYRYDMLRLVNGVSAILCYESLEAGDYTDILIDLDDTNEIVIDGEDYPLIVSSSAKTEVQLNQEFTLLKDNYVDILVDFEVSKSIDWTSEPYRLSPVFRIFETYQVGTLSGTVKDTSDTGIPNVLCMATTPTDTLSTLTGSTGEYMLILLEGNYDISVSAEGYTTSDTVYTGVAVNADSNLTGYDFICQQ